MTKYKKTAIARAHTPKKTMWDFIHSHTHIKSINEKTIAYSVLSVFILYVLAYAVITKFTFTWDFSWWALTMLPLIFVIDGVKGVGAVFKRKKVTGIEDSSKITFVIPCYNGEDTIETVIINILRRFNRKQIIVVSNGSVDGTVNICKKYPVKLVEIKEGVGKERAIQAGLALVETPYVVTMDDDTLINDAVIPTSLLDEGYGAVGFRVLPEPGNWVIDIQNHEYMRSMDVGKQNANHDGSVDCVSGAICLISKEELLRQGDLHTKEFSGEDLQRTLHIHLSGASKGVVLCDSTVYTFVPDTIGMLFRQRIFGWFPGLYANLNLFLKILFARHTSLSMRYTAVYNVFLVVFMDLIRVITLPLIIFHPPTFIAMSVIYFILDNIVYFSMKEKSRYWILLIGPVYGIFGLMTRLAAMSVFMYRRSVYHLKQAEYLDDHKQAPFWMRSATVTGILAIFAGYFSMAMTLKSMGIW